MSIRALIALVLVAVPALAATPKLLVLSPRTARASDRDLGVVVGELVVDAAGRAKGIEIVAEQEATAFLDGETRKQLDGCADDGACMVEIGGALGVTYLLAPALGGIGDQFLLTLRIFDAREGTLIARMNEKLPRDEKVLAAALCPKVHELFSLASAQGVPVESRPQACGQKAEPPPAPVAREDDVPPPPSLPQVVPIVPKPAVPGSPLAQVLADETIEPAKKRERMKQERGQPEAELVNAIAHARPADLRRELCMPYVGKGIGATVIVRAKDDDGSPAQGVVTIDGVRVGVTGAVLRVPACASDVLVEDPRTGAYWTGALRLAAEGNTEITARFPGVRYELEREVARDSKLRGTWFRTASTEALVRDQAESYCQNISAGGGGWGLPTVAELEATRVPGSAAAGDDVVFPRASEGWYLAQDGAVLFDAQAPVAEESPRFGKRADVAAGHVRCIRRHPRFAVRAGVGSLTGVIGIGVEWRPIRLVGVAIGFGSRNPTFGISLNRGDGESGYFVDAHLLRNAAAVEGASASLGGGITGGWDFRFLQRISVKVGGGISFHGTNWPLLLEANAGVVF